MQAHQLWRNHAKTESNPIITTLTSKRTPWLWLLVVEILLVMTDDQLTCSAHVAYVPNRPCQPTDGTSHGSFPHPLLEYASNGPERGATSGLQTSEVCLCHPTADWAPLVTSSINLKSLMLIYRRLTESAPSYLNHLVWAHLPLARCILYMIISSSPELYQSRATHFKQLLKTQLCWEQLLS